MIIKENNARRYDFFSSSSSSIDDDENEMHRKPFYDYDCYDYLIRTIQSVVSCY
jgi:hypothetical protein